jgi:hypothetical protein
MTAHWTLIMVFIPLSLGLMAALNNFKQNPERYPILRWPSYWLMVGLTLVHQVFEASRPWLKPWLHAHFSDPTASTIGNGISIFLLVGIVGCLASILRRYYA